MSLLKLILCCHLVSTDVNSTDSYQNVTDPQHCLKNRNIFFTRTPIVRTNAIDVCFPLPDVDRFRPRPVAKQLKEEEYRLGCASYLLLENKYSKRRKSTKRVMGVKDGCNLNNIVSREGTFYFSAGPGLFKWECILAKKLNTVNDTS